MGHLPIQCSAERKGGGQKSSQCSECSRAWIMSPHMWPVERPRLRLFSPAGGLATLGVHCQVTGMQLTKSLLLPCGHRAHHSCCCLSSAQKSLNTSGLLRQCRQSLPMDEWSLWKALSRKTGPQDGFPRFTAGQRIQVGMEKRGKCRTRMFQETRVFQDTAGLSNREAYMDAVRTCASKIPRETRLSGDLQKFLSIGLGPARACVGRSCSHCGLC